MASVAGDEDRASGFPPIAGREPRALILGTLPSVASIEKRQYYGHPQNAFWKIMYALLAGRDDGDTSVPEVAYAERTALLKRSGIAVWDVLGESVRPGSMDADIDLSTAEPNPLAAFLESHSSIALVGLQWSQSAGSLRTVCRRVRCDSRHRLRITAVDEPRLCGDVAGRENRALAGCAQTPSAHGKTITPLEIRQ